MKADAFLVAWLDAARRIEYHRGDQVQDYNTAWHFHDDWQLVHILSGQRVFEWRGVATGRTILRAGSSLVLPPGLVHRGSAGGGPASFAMLYISPACVADEAPEPIAQEPLIVTQARAWLAANPQRRDCSRDLAALTLCSPFHISRTFRRWTGLSPTAFRLQQRLLTARRRISAGEPLAGVAADLGFSDQSHLGRQFRRAFGLTPSAFAALAQLAALGRR